ncbi:hypothetical protein H8R17_13945 [Streptomyces sp. TRM68367]|nr:hypothetical protein [Streptomyces sp. TRM68367]
MNAAISAAADATRRHALSAQPGAPVVDDSVRTRRRRSVRTDHLRRAAASTLRRLAERIDPQHADPRASSA